MPNRLALLALLFATLTPGHFLPDELPSWGAAFAQDDDDDGAGGGGDDDDDAGGGGGGGGGSGGGDDDDDAGGGGGGDDDDDGGGGNGGDDDDDDGVNRPDRRDPVPVPRGIRRIDMQRGAGDRSRKAEISALGLDQADIRRLEAAGFRIVEIREVSRVAQGVAARMTLPRGTRERAALDLARQTVPEAIFDLSHLYGESQGAGVYAPELVRFAPGASCASGIRVGLIDGAVADHPLLSGARITRKSFSADNASALHGTAVASVMVGQDPSGRRLLSGARLFSAAVFTGRGNDATADAIDLVAAIDWMSEQNVGTVNMSIAGPENDLLRTAVARAAAGGMIIVAAAGNGGAGGKPRYPAAYPEVIAVSAVDARGRAYRYNSRGSHIDVAAPGVDIWAADARNSSGALWSGTSFAAPFVTVELGAARQAGLVGSVESARAYLAGRAQDLGAPGVDAIFGAGLMQSGACR